MRIVHVLTRLLRAGSEENTIATCLWQARAGHDVTVLHGPGADPFWEETHGQSISFVEVPSLVHPIHPVQDMRAVSELRKLYRDLEPDVIHTHQSKAGILGRLAASSVPSALRVHGIHIIPFDGVSAAKARFYVWAEKLVARHTDLFISVSRSVGQAYVDAGICRRVEPVYSGMPLAPFRNPEPPEDWRDLLAMEDGDDRAPVAILMLAAYEPRKRHVEFLEAYAKVLPELPPNRLLFAGKGPYEPQVRQAVEDLGLTEQVTFCGYRSDPHALIGLADICILTSEREGLPRVVVQYIAAGRPVIVADLPGIEEIVKHEVNGLVSDPADMNDTAGKLRDLLANRDHLAALATGARETDVSEWDLERLGARTTELYLESLQSLPKSRRSPSTVPATLS